MGTCYSKNTTGTSSESKLPKQILRDSKRNKKLTSKELSLETSPHKENGKNSEGIFIVDDSANSGRSRSSTPEILSGHFNEKHVNPGVAPSDSGIESIYNIEDEAAAMTQTIIEKDCHSNNLQQLRLESCHKCANHNLGNFSPPAHETNDNPLSGLGQAEVFTVISHCKTHGSQQIRSPSTKYCTKYNPKIQTFPENSTVNVSGTVEDSHVNMDQFKSSFDKSNHVNKIITLDRAAYLASDLFNNENDVDTAPLAEFDSIEANFNDSPSHFNQKRQSLLSEILDITQSLCKCDFYSTEYCTRDHGIIGAVPEAINDELNSETGASGQFDTINEHSSHFRVASTYKGESQNYSSGDLLQKFGTPNRKESNLPKNVSFATHEGVSSEASTEREMTTANKIILRSIAVDNGYFVPELFKSPSEECTNTTASELILSNRRTAYHMRSASLSNVRPVMSDSSSDAPDGGAEDDMASLDLDSISRVTSLSYSSIRQLVESTEDLISSRYTAQHVTIDGMECIVIPADSYHQMQMDLATLKQQLMNLSSLIQEVEDLEQN